MIFFLFFLIILTFKLRVFCLRGPQVAVLRRVAAELLIICKGSGAPEILQTLKYQKNEKVNLGRKILEDI